ncbi:MAG: hypothetical protein L0H96_04685 [Humibacillus sp.]|nr:hypothetical protein [Humibacillus sp.]MDN5776185.1 hypothetical protein [Humibacillus sp.]
MRSLQCRIEFSPPPVTPLIGTLRVRVVEMGRADASAVVMAESTIEDCQVDPEQGWPMVTLTVAPPEPPQQFALEAHLDVDGSGETSVGDYRTMEHFSVTGDDLGRGEVLTAQVREVS